MTFFGVCASIFGIICTVFVLSLLATSSRAYAFTVGDTTYPDTLVGVTVTLNEHITEPPSSAQWVNTWVKMETETPSSPDGMPQGDFALTLYGYFETTAHAGSSHPWFFHLSYDDAFQNLVIPTWTNFDYYARFGYDGYSSVQAYWGLKSGVIRPTVTFYDNLWSGESYKVLNDPTFIAWVCDNSDYFTRYPQQSWTNPTIERVDNSFGWSMPSSNVPSTLAIYRGSTIVEYYATSPLTGSYTASSTGTYKFVWGYVLNGVSREYESNSYLVNVSGDFPVFNSVVLDYGLVLSNVTITANVSNATHVMLQRSQAGTWVDVLELPLVSGTTYEVSTSFAIGYDYRLFAYNDGGYGKDYALSNASSEEDSNLNVGEYIKLLGQWVSQLMHAIPDLFAWMPDEIRLIWVSALVVMVVLGIIGWLKP